VFRCQLCHQVVPPRTPARRVALQTRARKYPYRPRANRIVRLTENGKWKEIFIDDPGGAGREVAVERALCPRCAAAQTAK
jgi:hypothetical protein